MITQDRGTGSAAGQVSPFKSVKETCPGQNRYRPIRARRLLRALCALAMTVAFSFNAYASDQSGDLVFSIRLKGGPAVGPKNAPVTLVEFTDFECPFCSAVQPALKQVLETYPNEVRLVFKNFPLPMHRNAREAHLAAMCAGEQGKFWEYRNHLFQNQRYLSKKNLLQYADQLGISRGPFEACLAEEKYASKIEDDIQEAVEIGVHGTPAFLINGKIFSGAQDFSFFQAMIEKELNQKNS